MVGIILYPSLFLLYFILNHRFCIWRINRLLLHGTGLLSSEPAIGLTASLFSLACIGLSAVGYCLFTGTGSGNIPHEIFTPDAISESCKRLDLIGKYFFSLIGDAGHLYAEREKSRCFLSFYHMI